jgi:hypothetical protein
LLFAEAEASALCEGDSVVDPLLHDSALPFGNLQSQKMFCAVSYRRGPSLTYLMTRLFYGSPSDEAFQLDDDSHVVFAWGGSFAGKTGNMERCNDGSVERKTESLAPVKLLMKVS